MWREEFRHYLQNVYRSEDDRKLAESTIKSRIAECRRIEFREGNLDELFERDGLEELLSRLRYTKDDQATHAPMRHDIPIEGNPYTGSATLKRAAKLYKAFREHPSEKLPQAPTSSMRHVQKPPVPKTLSRTMWPVWSQPQPDEALALARVVARYARFLRPEIVQAIVEDNEARRAHWSLALEERGIDPRAYLWSKSACAFPGVRRYAGSSEIAIFRKRAAGEVTDVLALDDNDYPKQVWSFMLTGRKFPKHGPQAYALAHLADHKVHKNRAGSDFEIVAGHGETMLHGLYTAPTNTAYLPVATIKPTDFGPLLRNLLMRRAQQLYGGFCSLLPPWLSIPAAADDDWSVDRFEWPEPVGDPERISSFLEFRHKKMEELIALHQPGN